MTNRREIIVFGTRRQARRPDPLSASCRRAGIYGGALALMVAMATIPGAANESEPSLIEVAKAFGFDETQVESLRAGKTVSADLDANSDNELALSMAHLSHRDVVWHENRLVGSMTSDPSTRMRGELTGDGKASLEAWTMPDEELDLLAEVEAGPNANFSMDEIALLHAASETNPDPKTRRAALQSVMREILAARYSEYRAGGLAAVSPYARGGGKETSPATQLERAFDALRMTRQLAPDTHAAMANFPTKLAEGVTSRFYWIEHDAQDREVVALSHVVFGLEGDRLAAIERRFYVSHTLNSLQAVAVAFPIAEGTVAFYANRTGTDQVTGFGSSIAKRVGRTIMRGQLERLIEAFKKDAARQD